MAINKGRLSPLMKAGIWLLAGTFALGVAAIPLSGLLTGTPTVTNPGTQNASQDTSQTLQSIELQFTPPIKAREASLAVEPNNYDLLVQQGQDYFEWASAVQQVTKGTTGQDFPIWKAAVPFYARALKVKPGDPNVTTDYAVTQFYSGDATAAVQTVKTVIDKDPKFSPAIFNLGIFYRAIGDTTNARAAFERYLAVDKNGEKAAAAKELLTELK